jgi:general secretion pathway protein E
VQAALTGHLVLSTLHTNNTSAAITRMQDLGIIPYLISSTLLCVLAQRLVRKICLDCKVESAMTPAQAASLKIKLPTDREVKISHGQGCVKCRSTGYLGRLGIFETLDISPKIVKLINAKADAKEIMRQAISDGLVNLRDHAIKKMAEGHTTFEEVLRVTRE